MRKNRYIDLDEIEYEIRKEYKNINKLENEVEHKKKRIKCLQCLLEYLYEHSLECPFSRKELLKNDIKLQYYVAPLLSIKELGDRGIK